MVDVDSQELSPLLCKNLMTSLLDTAAADSVCQASRITLCRAYR